MATRLSLLPSESDSSSSDDDEHQISIAEAYRVLDIRTGLLNPSRYCTAVKELKAVIQSLYKRTESTKELRKLVEADVQAAIYEYPG
jgi:transposase-like protein